MKRFFSTVAIMLCLLAAACVTANDAQPVAVADPAAPLPEGRALVISVDGLRPDLLLLTDCPNIRKLIARGSYSFWAQTTPVGITLPSHTSMMTGVHVETHGVTWNGSVVPDIIDFRYPKVPTLFEVAKAQKYTTAIAASKEKFDTLAKPGTVDWLSVPEGKRSDDETTEAAVKIIEEHQPQVMLFHLGDTDRNGHRHGWGTPEQLAAIENADACVGRVIDKLTEKGLLDKTLIILTADHGGFAGTHNGSDPRGLHIPWIAAGPGVRVNYDLTRKRDLVIHTEDTFATVCDYLDIPLPDDIDGKPIDEAFE